MERVKRIALLVLLAGLTLAGPAAGQETRIILPLERFLPTNTLAYLSLPDAGALQSLLTLAGENRAALAERLVSGTEVGAESTATLLEILQAVVDGPVTWSLHQVTLPGRPGVPGTSERHFLVSLASTRKGKDLEEVGRDLVRGLIAPVFASEAQDEQVMGFDALHLSGKGPDFYVVSARGRLFFSSSALILGRVLKEMRRPSGRTLYNEAEFRAARQAAATTAEERPHGFLWVNDPSLFPAGKLLDCRSASGVLVKEEDGYRDEVTVVTGERSILSGIAPDGKAPAAWARSAGDGIWFGATLTPEAVQRIAADSVQVWHAATAARIGDVAAGPVEVLLEPGRAPLLRIKLRPEADLKEVAGWFEDLARVEGRVMIFCEDPKARAAAKVGEELDFGAPMGLKAPVARLLDVLGSRGPNAVQQTTLTGTVVSRDMAAGKLKFSSGRAELGMFALIALSLTR